MSDYALVGMAEQATGRAAAAWRPLLGLSDDVSGRLRRCLGGTRQLF